MLKKPVIGITSSYVKHNHYMEGVYVHHDYHRAIIEAGGIPLILPISPSSMVPHYLSLCDGIIFSGGEDIDPQFYQEAPQQNIGFFYTERDQMEIELFHQALSQNKPILGICRGFQLMNVALGGTLIQDIPSQKKHSIAHFQSIPRSKPFHSVRIEKQHNLLFDIVQKESIFVNSLHHQGIERLAKDLYPVAYAPDGLIEAAIYEKASWVLGVQWHPESLANNDPLMKLLFQSFIKQCKQK